ncbi:MULTISPECIES: TonB-dependent siderophore receptor [unclassified Brevundimonas]|uniref:TonB-dependent receptor n=1 Tax=unclassified Brevundimonas TaxID=2622653 RepID=UPI000CFD7D79|nr:MULTISPECIES: TonB-dependent siderophore receptor [unclassified Brevundimonas]PRA29536.1 TonB-dependent siderophore receptor [Brevundimonas sp. MYb27]PQZ83653.1 TonB-dependent siderophore receptor [Brevundimonas sp. MYb31]PRB15758.1 TonB-dependent siderophore receptor [Brevundimonas sp. MYb52]PRB36255.1 TonB-dependent siderophore receptor [Brevundimonas sp. MYb46]PRB46835.1 TonB-dependent siderophore receptor [Brevundimonas sp. MYb33]
MSDARSSALKALLFASSAAGMLCASPVLASDVGAADETPIATADITQDATTLSAVDVHGQRAKREPKDPTFVAPLVDTPRSVTVIPQQIIEQTAATSLQDILRTSPGITFGAGEGGQPLADRPFIRGQASGNNIFVDGIRDTGGQQREVFNLEQVEVIKGPDSVYSGRGSGGGSINLGSKSPRLQNFIHGSAGAGTDSYARGTVDANWQVSPTAAMRLNLMASQGDVAGRNAVDFDKWGVAAAVAVGLGTPTTVTASYYHLDSDQMPDYGIPLYTKLAGANGPRPDASGVLDVPYDSFYGLKARDYLNNTVDSLTLDIEHRFSDTLALRNVTRYSQTLNDYIVTNPGDGGTAQNIGGVWWMKRGLKSRWNPAETLANVTDLHGSFNTGSIKHNFDIGLELSRETNKNAGYTVTTLSGTACPAPLTGFDCTPVYDPNPNDPWTGTITRGLVSKTDTDSLGVYAFDSITFGEKFIINLGLRWDDYSVDAINATGTVAAPVYTPVSSSWDFVNYQVGFVYKPTANTSVYASYATSSTPPTISAGDQNGGTGTGTGNLLTTVLDPEETQSFEIGAKANLFDDRLALSGALFQLTRKDAQIQVEPGVFEQAGEAEVRGLELGVSGNVTSKWQVFGGYTWMDSELVSGAYTNVNVGESLANTPEHTASLFTTYRVMPKLSLGGGVYYVGKSFGGNQGGAGGGTNRIYAPAYTRVDLFASYDISDRASLQLNVQNAGDEEYIIRTNGVHHADVAPARSAILTLNVRY